MYHFLNEEKTKALKFEINFNDQSKKYELTCLPVVLEKNVTSSSEKTFLSDFHFFKPLELSEVIKRKSQKILDQVKLSYEAKKDDYVKFCIAFLADKKIKTFEG